MTRDRSVLDILVAGLRGHLMEGTDWEAVIALANRTLLTPALFSALAGRLDQLPDDVADYLEFIHECNQERNRLLRGQLQQAVAALNGRGIVPVLLKGAVPLFLASSDQLPVRMTSDLDVGVLAAKEADARDCLAGLGYVQVGGEREMARVQDGGVIDLRCSEAVSAEAVCDGLRARVPSAESRALHWIRHDLLKEGDYWRGRIDLRHLHDLATLSANEPVDWSEVRAAATDRTMRNVIDTQLITLSYFFAVEIPSDCRENTFVRLQHARRIFTARHRVLGAPLRLVGNLSWAARQFAQSADLVERGPTDFVRRARRTLLDSRSKI